MDDVIIFKELKVLVPRLSDSIVDKYYERYKEDIEYMIESESESDDHNSQPPIINSYLQETGLNVSLIAKNDKKLVKLNIHNNNNNLINPKILSDNILKINSNEENDESMTVNVSYENYNQIKNDMCNNEDDELARTVHVTTSSSSSSSSTSNTSSKSSSICYQCTKCPKKFTNKIYLKSHMSQHKNDSLSSSSSLSTQTNTTKIICNECGKQLNSQTDFNRHLQLAHNAVKPYKCLICSMAFYDVSSKNRHEKEHSGLKPFRCYICGFEFTRASNLRAHLIKLHSSEIGKSVIISKTTDNKLKFEFDLDAINLYREQQRLNKCRINDNTTQSKPTNAVIYIKDPNNKSSDIQYMVVYVDGKPIFVQNPKGTNGLPPHIQQKLTQQQQQNQQLDDNKINENDNNQSTTKTLRATKIKSSSTTTTTTTTSTLHQSQQQLNMTKIPYLLAAAAAAANNQNRCTISNNGTLKKEKNDHEYQHLVSLFKQKNEKLFNPLANNLQNSQTDVPLLTNSQNNSVCL